MKRTHFLLLLCFAATGAIILSWTSLSCSGGGTCITCCSCQYSCSGTNFTAEGSGEVTAKNSCLQCEDACLAMAAEHKCTPYNGTVTASVCSGGADDPCSKSACDFEGQSVCDGPASMKLCIMDNDLGCLRWGAKGTCINGQFSQQETVCAMVDGGARCVPGTADGGSPDGGATDGGGGCYPNCAIGEMVTVPAGKFWMGCNVAVDADCHSDEKPYHEVNLPEFKIDKYEVTTGQYQACVDAGKCTAVKGAISECNFGKAARNMHPINCLEWGQAAAYCEWLGRRLPTEAEWEKAARGADGRKYPWGNENIDCDHAVMNAGSCGNQGTQPVGNKPLGVSPYGAEDMVGNVGEWVADWFDEQYYGNSPADNPQGPASGPGKVLRGGSWSDKNSHYLRTSNRDYYDEKDSYSNLGVRCAE